MHRRVPIVVLVIVAGVTPMVPLRVGLGGVSEQPLAPTTVEKLDRRNVGVHLSLSVSAMD
jgi:hypothetical protein